MFLQPVFFLMFIDSFNRLRGSTGVIYTRKTPLHYTVLCGLRFFDIPVLSNPKDWYVIAVGVCNFAKRVCNRQQAYVITL